MSYYDDASLVVIPSGYKTSKVYAEKPTDGSGDLAFTRTGDTATRVNSAGLIEKVRTNIYLNSEQFNNASWTKSNSTVTANTATAPNGTTTADTLSDIVGISLDYLLNVTSPISYTSGTPYTVSFYAKNVDRRYMYIRFVTNAFGSNKYAYFDLQDGVISKLDAGTTATITAVGDGWYRCTASASATTTVSTIFAVYIGLSADGLNNFYINAVPKSVYIWGAQLETSEVATAYIPTTTAAVSVGPVANVPRLDYLGSTCPRLLLEPQRTNLVTNSENISGSNWTNIDSTDSINVTATLDPSGYYGADKLQETTANAAHVIAFQTGLMSSANTYTFSSFLKAAERNWVALYIYNGTSSFVAYFNLTTGVKGSVTSGVTSAIQSYGNGWYRCSITLAVAGSALANGGVITATADGTISYVGTAGSGIYLWGAQLEAGAYATSYIPTLAASATRGADATYKGSISSLIGATEGVLFADFIKPPTGTPRTKIARLSALLTDSGNSFANSINLDVETNGNLRGNIVAGGTSQVDIQTAAYAAGTRIKMALAYKANDVVLYINGTQIGTDTSATIPVCTAYEIASYETVNSSQTNYVSQALLFKTRLSNASLAELTTL